MYVSTGFTPSYNALCGADTLLPLWIPPLPEMPAPMWTAVTTWWIPPSPLPASPDPTPLLRFLEQFQSDAYPTDNDDEPVAKSLWRALDDIPRDPHQHPPCPRSQNDLIDWSEITSQADSGEDFLETEEALNAREGKF